MAAVATSQMLSSKLNFAELASSSCIADSKALASLPTARRCVTKRLVVTASGKNTADGETCSRRTAFLLAAAAAGFTSLAEKPAFAAYGQAANIFGSRTPNTGYIPVSKDGFTIEVPSKWNPSRELDFDNVVLRWEDNFDQGSHLVVLKQSAQGKKSIDDYGTPEAFIDKMKFLLGEQVFNRETGAEGGFAKDRVLAANILASDKQTDKSGNSYYKYEILTRTADGTEGGRHTLITAAVKNGELFVSKVTIGDKRWFKGLEKDARHADASFSIA